MKKRSIPLATWWLQCKILIALHMNKSSWSMKAALLYLSTQPTTFCFSSIFSVTVTNLLGNYFSDSPWAILYILMQVHLKVTMLSPCGSHGQMNQRLTWHCIPTSLASCHPEPLHPCIYIYQCSGMPLTIVNIAPYTFSVWWTTMGKGYEW